MSTQDEPHESSTGDRLKDLAAEGKPVVTDPDDRYGIADDPDAIDSYTGRRPRGPNDSATEAAGVAGVAAAGGMSGATGTPGMGVPLLGGARNEGADISEAADAPSEEPSDNTRESGS